MISFKTGEDYYNKIYLHFNALVAVTLIPFGILLLEIQSSSSTIPFIDGTIATVLIIGIILISGFLIYRAMFDYKANMRKMDKNLSLRGKLEHYYRFSLKKYIQISASCGLIVLGLFLTRNQVLIPIYVIGLVLLSIGRPTLRDISAIVNLSTADEKILYDKKDIE